MLTLGRQYRHEQECNMQHVPINQSECQPSKHIDSECNATIRYVPDIRLHALQLSTCVTTVYMQSIVHSCEVHNSSISHGTCSAQLSFFFAALSLSSSCPLYSPQAPSLPFHSFTLPSYTSITLPGTPNPLNALLSPTLRHASTCSAREHQTDPKTP